MGMARLYLDQPLSCASELRLSGAPAHYLGIVLRARLNDQVLLFNGDGYDYPATIAQLEKKSLVLTLHAERLDRSALESPLQLELGLCLTKGQKMDLVIQKLVELGVSAITPVISTRSVVRLDAARAVERHAHWQGIIIAACEQCGRARLPALHGTQSLSDWAAGLAAGERVLLDPTASTGIDAVAHNPAHSIALAIGPEGGFAAEELTQLQSQRFVGVRLGPRVLRAETAPLAAVAVLQARFGDFR